MEISNDILNALFIIILCGILFWGERSISKASRHDFGEDKK